IAALGCIAVSAGSSLCQSSMPGHCGPETKKAPTVLPDGALSAVTRASGNRLDGHVLAVLRTLHQELHPAFGGGEDGVVTAQAGVLTSVEAGAALTHDDLTCLHNLAAEALDAKAFTF